MTNKGTEIFRRLLDFIGEDPSREGLKDTPDRMTKVWKEWTAGYTQDPASVLKSFEYGAQNYDEMVFQGNIPVYSMCEHHLAPFFGVAHIGYIPHMRVVGLSKLSRLVDVFSRRLQVQERLTQEIANCLNDNLQCRGVGVVMRCRHMCMESRGINRPGTVTYTSCLLGNISQRAARTEFMTLVHMTEENNGKT